MVQQAIPINIIKRKNGKIPVPMIPDKLPNSTGVSIILRFEHAISIPMMDWDVSLLKRNGVRWVMLGNMGPFPSPIRKSPKTVKTIFF